MKLSFVCSGYRTEKFKSFYESINKSFSQEWELIIVGPNKPDFEKDNLVWIEDWGCPTRCAQRGWLAAKADWICFCWDDAVFDVGGTDAAWEEMKKYNFDYRTVLICKWTEGTIMVPGSTASPAPSYMLQPQYYQANFHDAIRSPNIPDSFKLYMTGLISKKIMTEVGGLDCRYEILATSQADLSLRLQFLTDCKMVIGEGRLLQSPWFMANTGDRGPLDEAYIHDRDLLQSIYRSAEFKIPPPILIENWEKSPSKWIRRFPNG